MLIPIKLRYSLTKTKLRAPLIWFRHRYVRPADVVLASYPRSGSTWLRFLLFDLLSRTEADFVSVQNGIPGIENQSTAIPFLQNSGRLLQTHEFYRKDYHKAIYLVRDVRDVLISEYYFGLRKGVVTADFDSFFLKFLDGKVNPYGFWGKHVESWLASPAASADKVLLVKYEDLQQDVESTLLDILRFLEVSRDLEDISKVVVNYTIDKMREKENSAPKGTFKIIRPDIQFVRKGTSSGWKETLSNQQRKMIENRLGKTLEQLGYSFKN